ncbi:SdiA-regulated domain-containing protein [Luteirhabdus pelagi]|uniref:SdiA-regulated domain-containing protein n=1 Tax=Luteirhabdus pelagi TaxID=2792783 RepID=UPI00193AA215|nr:SdiA-regulated domain-containing protein [Luteirhabdus pelagi]
MFKTTNVKKFLILTGLTVTIVGLSVWFFYSFKAKNEHDAKLQTYSIEQKWELPSVLAEVSGLAWYKENVIICIQDEEGVLFFYNIETSKIEKEVSFAGSGDYEGLTLFGDTVFVTTSDGDIYEITNFTEAEPTVKQYDTPFFKNSDIESVAADNKNNRLLLIPKGKSLLKQEEYKGIYAFDVTTKKMDTVPIVKLYFNDPIFEDIDLLDDVHYLTPSEIGVHPETRELYLLETGSPKLIELTKDGEFKRIHHLSREDFSQPEGLTFSPDGTMYISNEGSDGPPNILKVRLKEPTVDE